MFHSLYLFFVVESYYSFPLHQVGYWAVKILIGVVDALGKFWCEIQNLKRIVKKMHSDIRPVPRSENFVHVADDNKSLMANKACK